MIIWKIGFPRCPRTHPGPKDTLKWPREGQNWRQCTSCGPTNWFRAKKNKFESVTHKLCPFHSESPIYEKDTSNFRNGAYRRQMVTVFAPAGVTYDEIIKAMHPTLDYRYLRETSYRGDKFVYYPPAMHRDACTCSECKNE